MLPTLEFAYEILQCGHSTLKALEQYLLWYCLLYAVKHTFWVCVTPFKCKLLRSAFFDILNNLHSDFWERFPVLTVLQGLKGQCADWFIVFRWLWPGACFKLALLCWNRKKISQKLMKAKKSQKFHNNDNFDFLTPATKSNLINCNPLPSF